jgi:hypothetical protein
MPPETQRAFGEFHLIPDGQGALLVMGVPPQVGSVMVSRTPRETHPGPVIAPSAPPLENVTLLLDSGFTQREPAQMLVPSVQTLPPQQGLPALPHRAQIPLYDE